MEKLKLHTPDFTQENIARLAELFPNCITESGDENGKVKRAIDFDQLRQELSSSIVEGSQERYQLNWPGKREALLTANAPITKTLRPCREESVDFDTTENLFIEGDNLDALKLLQETYLNKVKMIYIDPPYNTGKDFIYEDNFTENSDEYLERSSQKDKTGNRMVANTEANGRFHSDWLSMLYPRLKLARNLLSDDGVIFISIDDSEAPNLKKICDEIFGEQNHLITHYIQVRYAGKTLAEKNDYQKLIEQVLVYQKSNHSPIKQTEDYLLDGFKWKITETTKGRVEVIGGREVEIFTIGQYIIEETTSSIDCLKETWATGSVLKVNASGKYFGTHLAPRKEIDGLGTLYKVKGIGEDGLGYRYFTGPKRETATKGTFFSGVPTVRRLQLENDGKSSKSKSIVNFYDFADSFGNCRHEGGVGFRGGKKPIKFIETLISQACNEGIVLDFFAGSGSSAHAVMKVNSEDGGLRKFIAIQLPELLNEDDKDLSSEFKTISKLSMERIRRSGVQLKRELAAGLSIDVGFRVLKVDSSNMNDVFYSPDEVRQGDILTQINNIREGRNEEDLLFQVLLDWGVDLSLPITREVIAGKNVFFVDENALAACFEVGIDESFVKLLAAKHPLRAVFFDASFASDSVKINIEQIFKLISPTTEIKTI